MEKITILKMKNKIFGIKIQYILNTWKDTTKEIDETKDRVHEISKNTAQE